MSSDEMPQGDGGEQIIARSLSANAREFQLPASTPVGSAKAKVKPVKASRDPFETLDYVPFTPSQGICTPSPSNVAAMWMARRCVSDLNSDGTSISSMASSMTDYGAGPIFIPANAMYPVYPMPYSPSAAHPMFAASIPSPHHHHHGPWSPAAGGPAGAAAFFAAAAPSPMAAAAAHAGAMGTYVGSPVPGGLAPGRSIFAKYLVQEGYGSEPSNSPQNSSDGSSAPSSGQKSDKQRSVSPGAIEAAIAWCADKGLKTNEPPQAIVELASLALAYGIDLESASDLAAAAATGPSTNSSPVKPTRQEKQTNTQNIKLNARQRRTLRRALDRALAALEQTEEEEERKTDEAGPRQQQQQHKNQIQPQQQATYKTPMKTNNSYDNDGDAAENEYLQITPSGPNSNNMNNNHAVAQGVVSMAFGSPAIMHPHHAHHHQNWQNGCAVPMHMPMGYHAVATAAAETAMAQISMAQMHQQHAQAASGYMGPMPMSPHHHMMAVPPGHAMPAVYHQDQMQQSMGPGAQRGRMNRAGQSQSRFAPKVASK